MQTDAAAVGYGACVVVESKAASFGSPDHESESRVEGGSVHSTVYLVCVDPKIQK